MILYFATGKYTNTLKTVLNQWAPELRKVIKPMTYEDLWKSERLPIATYIFSDFERMSPEVQSMAAAYADQLRPHGRILNEPHMAKARYELLKDLSASGINDFRIFRADDIPNDVRYPIFVRPENDHKGPRSELLYSPADVAKAYMDLVARGFEFHRLVAVEFMARKNKDGLYHRHGTHNLGGEIFSQVLTYTKDWCVKGLGVRTPEIAREEEQYNIENPHADQIKRAFEIGGIDYGRMDYSVIDDRIQVYEINTNPVIIFRKNELNFFYRRRIGGPFIKKYAQRMQALDSGASGEVEIDRERILDSVLPVQPHLAVAV